MTLQNISAPVLALLLVLSLSVPSVMPIVAFAQEVQQTAQPDVGETGESGEPGTDGGVQTPPEEGDGSGGASSDTPTTVNTGDATSGTDAGNTTNTNIVTTEPDWSHPETLTGWAKWKYYMCEKYPEGHYKRPRNCPVIQTVVTTDNDAVIDAAATSTATTGENTVEGGDGGAVINTGDATAFGNAINVANSNIINSSGMLLFLNLLFGQAFDMRTLDLNYFFGGSNAVAGCSLTGCGSDLVVNADNTAVVTNSLVVRAVTGDNEGTATGDVQVNTGNAYAAGNAVNLINTNIIDSNYLLVTLNSFGDMASDLILPGADFFSKLLALQQQMAGGLTVNANNTATVTDSTAATADSGANAASTEEGNATIDSGNAISSATAINQVNTNLVGGTQIFMLFRVWGDWSGSIQGLPEGMMWEETPFGIVLKNSDGTPASTGALKGACTLACGSDLTVNATNTATLGNNVNVFALTGDNRAYSASGTAGIATGNAFAAANSVNMVNTNLIGQNWMFMIFNIFGNFSGNIAFGRPDLWVGASAETTNPTLPGSPVTYHFTVSNKGDSDATHVRLKAKFDKALLRFSDGSATEEGMYWDLGTIRRGETREFTYRATAGRLPDGVSAAVPMEATVVSNESDNNTVDNTEKIDLVISNPSTIVSRGVTAGGYEPKISIQKSANVTATTTPALVDYTVIVKNDGGDAYNVNIIDTLRGPEGRFIGDQRWNLGRVKPNEEIKITYTVKFGRTIKPGTYTNTIRLTGMKNLSIGMEDMVTTHSIDILPPGEVLGAAAAVPEPKVCTPYLTEFIRPGVANSALQVQKLQVFLKEKEGETGLEATGEYDASTIEAVKRFQMKHRDRILTPWGKTAPTAAVYLTTQKTINEIQCNGSVDFSLKPDQLQEIGSFKAAPKPVSKAVSPKRTSSVAAVTPVVPIISITPDVAPVSATDIIQKSFKNLSSWFQR